MSVSCSWTAVTPPDLYYYSYLSINRSETQKPSTLISLSSFYIHVLRPSRQNSENQMLVRAISRNKFPIRSFTSITRQGLIKTSPSTKNQSSTLQSNSKPPISDKLINSTPIRNGLLFLRQYHDGRPRGPLWRGKKLIGKEALFVILGMKRFKDDEEKLNMFIKNHVLRLLKMDMIAVLTELERQGEEWLSFKMFRLIQKQDWYNPDVFLYKDLIVALARSKKMDDVMKLWEDMRKEDLFPDSQTYVEVIRGFLKDGSPADAMNVYEDMMKAPDPPEELPFRIMLKGLLPHPLLRNKVKKDFEELFPEKHVYDPPEEIFGKR